MYMFWGFGQLWGTCVLGADHGKKRLLITIPFPWVLYLVNCAANILLVILSCFLLGSLTSRLVSQCWKEMRTSYPKNTQPHLDLYCSMSQVTRDAPVHTCARVTLRSAAHLEAWMNVAPLATDCWLHAFLTAGCCSSGWRAKSLILKITDICFSLARFHCSWYNETIMMMLNSLEIKWRKLWRNILGLNCNKYSDFDIFTKEVSHLSQRSDLRALVVPIPFHVYFSWDCESNRREIIPVCSWLMAQLSLFPNTSHGVCCFSCRYLSVSL